MLVDISCQPSYALAYLRLNANEAVNCENGAMVAMSQGINLEVSTGGSIMAAAFRKTLGQESFFMSRYRATTHGAWVAVAPMFPGDITSMELTPDSDLIMQTGAFLASSETINTSARIGGVGTLLQKEGLTVLRAQGEGTLLICSYGGLQKFDLNTDEKFIVDTGHLVAWPSQMPIRIGPLASAARSAISGEFLVAELTGPGTVFIQTRAEQGFRAWLGTERLQNKN